MPNLFSRLASYGQNPDKLSIENFTTELLAHLINTDRRFRRVFINLVIPDGRTQRVFRRASAKTQQSFGDGIVDLVLHTDNKRVLVEVKIGAAETKTKIYGRGWVPQVKKYLSYQVGPVVYLTTQRVPPPDVNSRRFLGQCYFEALYRRLSRANLSPMGRLFVEFMEENDMKALEPFTRSDLAVAGEAFAFAKKCQSTLDEVTAIILPQFRKRFHTRTRFTTGHFSAVYDSAYAWTTNFKRGGIKIIFIYFEPLRDGDFIYGVSAHVFKDHMRKLNRYLGWDEEKGAAYTSHIVHPNTDSRRIAKQVLKDLRVLRRAMQRAA